MASAAGRPVDIRACAGRIEIRQEGRIAGDHARSFGRGQTVCDPWRHVPVLVRKPGALRNGAICRDRVLPGAIAKVRRKPRTVCDGDRQMADILRAVLADGPAHVQAAGAGAIARGVHSADVVLDILARSRDPAPAVAILAPDILRLSQEPLAGCTRRDSRRRTI